MDCLLDVFKDAAPFAHSRNNGGEIVIRQDHIRRSFRHIGSGLPHRASDVRGL